MTGGTVIGREGRKLALAGTVALLALAGSLALGGAGAQARGSAEFELVDLGNFHDPVHVSTAPGATSEDLLFVVSQSGKIRVLENEEKVRMPFLDIRDIVQFGGEQGLLSVAFHPDYETNRRFFVYYINNQGDIRIDQFKRRASDPLRASPGSKKKVIKIVHDQASNHNGGQLQMGPDGYLYAGIGDGGPQKDPENDAQNIDSLLGKLIRIDPLPEGGYTAPAGNPYVGVAGADEIYAIGLRNPWRFSFDSANGAPHDRRRRRLRPRGDRLRRRARRRRGRQLRLERLRGLHGDGLRHRRRTPARTPSRSPTSATTATTSARSPAATSIHDPGLSALQGEYIFSDLCASDLATVAVPSGAAGTPLNLSVGSPVSFGEGEDGQIYVVDLGGNVYRLEQQ